MNTGLGIILVVAVTYTVVDLIRRANDALDRRADRRHYMAHPVAGWAKGKNR